MKDFLQELRDANITRQKEWDKESSIDLSYRGNELAGEVGEACNIIKKLDREKRGIRGSRATPQELADELADVIVCVDLIAAQFNINIRDAVRRKFNATSRKVGLNTFIECPVCGSIHNCPHSSAWTRPGSRSISPCTMRLWPPARRP